MLTRGIKTKLGIKRGHPIYLVNGDIHGLAQLVKGVFREIAQLVLDGLEDRYQIGPLRRVLDNGLPHFAVIYGFCFMGF
jgi:hypothetical protein